MRSQAKENVDIIIEGTVPHLNYSSAVVREDYRMVWQYTKYIVVSV